MQLRASWGAATTMRNGPHGIVTCLLAVVQPAELRTAMELRESRIFACARCGREVRICRCCDRGHRYCGEGCSKAARRDSMRRAGAKYQKTDEGSANHGARQQRYEERRDADLTHHTPPMPPAVIEMEPSLEAVAPEPSAVEAGGPDHDESSPADLEEEGCQAAGEVPSLAPEPSAIEAGNPDDDGPAPAGMDRQAFDGGAPSPPVRCDFCGCQCHAGGRRDFLRRRGGATGSRRPRTPRAPQPGPPD